MRPFANSTLNKKAVVAGFLCLPASIVFAAFNYYIFYIYAPLDAAKEDGSMKGMGPVEMAVRTHHRPEMADGIDIVELGKAGLGDDIERLAGRIREEMEVELLQARSPTIAACGKDWGSG